MNRFLLFCNLLWSLHLLVVVFTPPSILPTTEWLGCTKGTCIFRRQYNYAPPSVVDASGSKQLDEILALLKKQQDEVSNLKTQVRP